MHIGIVWHNDQFNVELCGAQGREPFLTVRGCRIVNGSKGAFVSWPSRKMDNGKYWNHCYASDAFGQAVLEAAQASSRDEKPDTRTLGQRRAPRPAGDVPF